ncbi:MAG TPA: substrate-binding domain-containing protein [Bryobacteraceae bacterium]|nr:substrate-binding domain-containing protein [Bryobacteraceae bacterium]
MRVKLGAEAPLINRKSDRYWVPIVAKTIDLLDCFGSDKEFLTLEEVVQRTGIAHTTAYRILHTLTSRDYLRQVGRKYRLNRLRSRLKIGFANLSKQIALAVEIQRSLERAANDSGIDLLTWDNDRNAQKSIENAEAIVASKVDVAIEFQLFEQVAPVIAEIFSKAGIPLISIVNPHHGTFYFGVDNYRAGYSAGLALAEYAMKEWKTRPESLLLLESPKAGRTVQSRLVGVVRGIEERLGPLGERVIHHIDGGGDAVTSKAAVENFLRRRPETKILIAGINDESAIGAVEAAKVVGKSKKFAVVGHGGSDEILAAMAVPGSPCLGTVSFRAELYGPGLVEFVVPVLQGRSANPIHYVAHEFVGKSSRVFAGE